MKNLPLHLQDSFDVLSREKASSVRSANSKDIFLKFFLREGLSCLPHCCPITVLNKTFPLHFGGHFSKRKPFVLALISSFYYWEEIAWIKVFWKRIGQEKFLSRTCPKQKFLRTSPGGQDKGKPKFPPPKTLFSNESPILEVRIFFEKRL